MSQFNDGGYEAFPVDAAYPQYSRLKLNGSGVLTSAGLTDLETGVLRDAAFAAGDARTIALRTKPGTVLMIAAGAISQGAEVYTAATGQISATQGSGASPVGVAFQAATAQGDVIEVMRY